MSVTFFVEGGPTELVQDIDWDGELEFDEAGKPVMHNEDVHSMNVSNQNAKTILNAIGIDVPDGWHGIWPVDQLPEIRQRLVSTLNGNFEHLTRPFGKLKSEMARRGTDGNVTEIGRGMTIIDCGINVQQIRDRLERLQAIVVAAQELNKAVIFA